MNLNLSPEDVDKIVKQAILNAGVTKAITDAVVKCLQAYNSPVEAAVKDYVSSLTQEIIRENHSEEVKAAVVAAVAERLTKEFIGKVTDETLDKMVRAVHY